MTKTELLQQIEDDLTLTQENLEGKLYNIPMLHSKYLRLFLKSKGTLNKLEKQLSELYLQKYNHFKNSKELLDKKEIQFHILGDEEYAKLNYNVHTAIDLVDILDRTLKKVNNMSFDVRNLIEYLKYMNGS